MSVLNISCLGGLEFSRDGSELDVLKSQKGRALLCYLAVTGGEHTRSSVAGLLWSDMPETKARTNLRKTLSRLKKHLGDYLLISRETVAFYENRPHWIDVKAFEDGVFSQSDVARLKVAISHYHGDFLEGFVLPDAPLFDAWMLTQRARYREAAIQALETLAGFHSVQGEYETAVVCARRLLELEPWREETHRDVMRLLYLSDQRTAALHQYEICRQLLHEELGVEPGLETVTLYEAIRDDQPVVLPSPKNTSEAVKSRRISDAGIPPMPASLIGRKHELDEIAKLLNEPDIRLVNITGPGGIGKTHLAAVMAQQVAENKLFADGVIYVPLESTTSRPALVVAVTTSMTARLNLPLTAAREPEKILLNQLSRVKALFVLDNFEQLLAEVDLLEHMMRAAPESKFLVTSRERLRLRSEWVYDLDGLPYPKRSAEVEAENYDAVQLFYRRARQVRPAFSLKENLDAVVTICQLTLGMPLALELAASWILTLPARDIADQIEQGIGTLSTSLRDVPARHRSLHAVFEGSWGRLEQNENETFARLSVFRGGFTLEAAAQVAGATLSVLSALVDKSLLRRVTWKDNTARYQQHELIRQFAYEKLQMSGSNDETHRQHLEYFLLMAEQAEQHWDTWQEALWLDRLEVERDNLLVALNWSLEEEKTELALRLNAALFTFWVYKSPPGEAIRWLEKALDLPWDKRNEKTLGARAKALNVAGFSATFTSNYALGMNRFEQGLALYQQLEDQRGIAWSLRGCGYVSMIQGKLPEALSFVEQSHTLCCANGDDWGTVWSIYDLGSIALASGDLEKARQLVEDALCLFRSLGVEFGTFRALITLGHVARGQHQWQKAKSSYLEALTIQKQTGYSPYVADALEGLAHIASQDSQPERAVRLLGAAQIRRDSIEWLRWAQFAADFDRTQVETRRLIPEKEWQAAWSDGYAMPAANALAYAMETKP